MSTNSTPPLYIEINPIDNVAIIVNDSGLPKGTVFPDRLVLCEHIPQGHKVALVDINKGQEFIRYGEVIGYAITNVPKGAWVNESVTKMPVAPKLHELPLATKVPDRLSPLEGYTFEGYRNIDGSVGTRNILGIIRYNNER